MIERSGDRLLVSGNVTIDTVNELFKEGLKLNQNGASTPDVIVDFAGLGKIDSSAVSLMLAWLRESQRCNAKLKFANVPENLNSLANLYGVSGLLNLDAA